MLLTQFKRRMGAAENVVGVRQELFLAFERGQLLIPQAERVQFLNLVRQ